MATKGLKNKKIGQTTTEPMGRESKLTLFMVNMGRDLQATEVMDSRITMTGRKVRKMTAITTTSTRIKDGMIKKVLTTKVLNSRDKINNVTVTRMATMVGISKPAQIMKGGKMNSLDRDTAVSLRRKGHYPCTFSTQ